MAADSWEWYQAEFGEKRIVHVPGYTRADGTEVSGYEYERADRHEAGWQEAPDFKSFADLDTWWDAHYPDTALSVDRAFAGPPVPSTGGILVLSPNAERAPASLASMTTLVQQYHRLARDYPLVAESLKFVATGPAADGRPMASSYPGGSVYRQGIVLNG